MKILDLVEVNRVRRKIIGGAKMKTFEVKFTDKGRKGVMKVDALGKSGAEIEVLKQGRSRKILSVKEVK